jgi:predicted metal-dependent enzyme (double-stranded beta helix superfamily)
MAYALDDFCADCKSALQKDQGDGGREAIRANLENLLKNQDFIAEYCGPDAETGTHELHHDREQDFIVLSHIWSQDRQSPPHDHGPSWAIYGQAVQYTEIKEFDRNDDGSKDGFADIEMKRDYRLEPGMAGIFAPGDIHSIKFEAGSRFVRVTGGDLTKMTTQKFNMAEKTVDRIEPNNPNGPSGSQS